MGSIGGVAMAPKAPGPGRRAEAGDIRTSVRRRLTSSNTNVTMAWMFELRGYIDEAGNKPFAKWFEGLDAIAAAKVAMAITRIERGNLSNTKGVGKGVLEYRIDFGPGYRIYFGKDGQRLVILIGGGTKKRQQDDINVAQAHWREYKQRRAKELE